MQLLADILSRHGVEVVVTRDPGGTPLGRQLREILLHHPGFVSPRCELFLYLADRAQHVDQVIRPALAESKTVLCDRYVDSTVAYQGGGRGLSVEAIIQMNRLATENLMPDKTILLDAPVEILLHRAKNRGEADRLEQETVTFYEKVRKQYLALAQGDPNRFIVLDAAQPVDVIQQHLVDALSSLMKPGLYR